MHWTAEEETVFIDLVRQYPVLQSRQNSLKVNGEKLQAWEDIAGKLASEAGTRIRTVQQLRDKWDNMKRSAKKAGALSKFEVNKTGGGKPANFMNEAQQKVVDILGDEMDPLLNPHDCDAGYHEKEIEIAGNEEVSNEVEIKSTPPFINRKRRRTESPAVTLQRDEEHELVMEMLALKKQLLEAKLRIAGKKEKLVDAQLKIAGEQAEICEKQFY